VVGRRLAVVQLVETGAATRTEVAASFGVSNETARRWSRSYEEAGTEALGLQVKGPKRASKLTEEKRQEIRQARAGGRSMAEVAEACGVSLNSVSRALRGDDPLRARSAGTPRSEGNELVPLARPEPRPAERQAARAGLLAGAAPVFCDGASLPLAGALLVLPALVAGGLMGAVEKVYGTARRACFYGLTSLVLTVVLSSLVGEPRAEGLSRLDPVALGRLLGMDRAPEVGTWRRRMEELATLGRSEDLVEAMAAAHLAANQDLPGIFCLDGHVRAYHGRSHLPKAHLAGHAWPCRHRRHLGHRLQGRRGDGLDGGAGRHAQRRAVTCDDRDPLPGRPGRPSHAGVRPGRVVPGGLRRGRRGWVPHPHLQER